MSNQYFGDDRIVHESLDVSKASSRRIYSNPEASDDIVTRLRDEARLGLLAMPSLTNEAADEIERLRAENRELRAENKSLEIDVTDWRTLAARLTVVLQKDLNK